MRSKNKRRKKIIRNDELVCVRGYFVNFYIELPVCGCALYAIHNQFFGSSLWFLITSFFFRPKYSSWMLNALCRFLHSFIKFDFTKWSPDYCSNTINKPYIYRSLYYFIQFLFNFKLIYWSRLKLFVVNDAKL